MTLNKKQTTQIKVLSEKFELDLSVVKEKFNKILTSKQLTKRDEDVRPQLAMRMLLAQLSSQKDKSSFGGKPEDVVVRVEMKEEPTQFKRADGGKGFRSSVYCTVSTKKREPFFAVMTLWNDANECNPNMVVGKTYRTKAVINDNGLSMNDPEILTPCDDKLPPMSDIITLSYPIVEITDMGDNVSEDWNDLKLIKGVISGAWSKETRTGNMMGFLKLISEDGEASMVAKFSRIYEQVNYWDDGSLIYVLGQITSAVYDEDSGELQYDVSAWGNLVIPIEAFEKEIDENDDNIDDTDDNNDNDVDLGDDDWDEDWDE